MAKEYYDVSYRTYFNDRLKPVEFRGRETYPLYIQVTHDRRTIFFKSYYFDLLRRSKYDFSKPSLDQVDQLENQLIEYLIALKKDRFDLDDLARNYKAFGSDVLDKVEGLFKVWLADYFKKESLPGLADLMGHVPDEVAMIRVWEDLEKMLPPDTFEKMEDKALRDADAYMLLASYVRGKQPGGPFCLPFHEWHREEKRVEIEFFLDDIFWRVDMGEVIRTVGKLYPAPLFR
jgi:hypothetical protein